MVRNRWIQFAFLLAVLSLTLPSFPHALFAKDAEKPKIKFCEFSLRSLKRALWTGAGVATLGVWGPSIFYSGYALAHGFEAEKSGLMLDIPAIESHLSIEERQLLKAANRDDVAVASMFSHRFSGGYDTSYLTAFNWLPAPRRVSTYLDPDCEKRGICRDKSIALAATLNHYGIRAELRTASKSDTQPYGHQWVYLPDYDLVLDPALKEIGPSPIDQTTYLSRLRDYGFLIDPPDHTQSFYFFIKSSYQR